MSENYKTPYFLIDKESLDDGLNKLNDSLKVAWGNYIIGYSYKTNALPWVINYFKQHRCYAEVVSADEYNLAKSIGVPKDFFIYNGIAKTKDTFIEAIKNHAIVNIDSEYEIDWLDELNNTDNLSSQNGKSISYEVGIRVNFDLESRCPGHSQCAEDGGRFGFCYENGDLKRAIRRIEQKGVKLTGIHLHKSSKTRMPDVYKAIAEVAVEIGNTFDLELSYIDIGGGFFGGLETKPKFPEYFTIVAEILKKRFNPQKTTLIVEPGNALIASPIDYYTTVLDIKKNSRNIFVVIDGSRTQIDPLMTKKSYFYKILNNDKERSQESKRECKERQIICGFTCMEHDRLFEINNQEEIRPGDKIVFQKVGAYTMCLTPLFIKWFPDVYVKDNKTVIKIRDKWESREFLGHDYNFFME